MARGAGAHGFIDTASVAFAVGKVSSVPLSFLTGPVEATSLTISSPVVMVGNEEHKGENKGGQEPREGHN